MAFLEISDGGREARIFKLRRKKTIVGRAEDADIVLPNVSVSRRHAMVQAGKEDAWRVVDLESSNGVAVNGEKVAKRILKDGDKIQVGKYVLVFRSSQAELYTDDAEGRSAYAASLAGAPEGATFAMRASDALALRRALVLEEKAVVASLDEGSQVWRPGRRTLVLAADGDIPVKGLGARAELSWSGTRHVVTWTGLVGGLSTNGRSVSKAALSPGDTFTVGRSSFVYRAPEG